jgi:ferredoxin
MNKPMSKEREKSLRKLAKLMNTRHQMPFLITKPLLRCFDLAIPQEEVDFLIRMGEAPRSYEEAASLSGLSRDSFQPFFEKLLKKGLVWTDLGLEGKDTFLVPGIMLGWFEIYLSSGEETPEKMEFARALDDLFKSWGKMNFFPFRNFLNHQFKHRLKPHQAIVAAGEHVETAPTRKIEVNRLVDVKETEVYPSTSVRDLIEKHGNANNIAVVHCFCRRWRKMVGEPCGLGFPSESCMVIGRFTKQVVDYGIGRYISKDEALDLIRELEEKGAVHQVFHEKENIREPEIGICNCCWDCCGVLGSYNRGILPLHFRSYFLAQHRDDSDCTGCGVCEEHCPVQAITVRREESHIDPEKCIGCGQCALQCPEDRITLVYKEREVMLHLQKKSKARIAA